MAETSERAQASAPAQAPGERLRALRVLDAEANRVREGLRVVEDYVRFVLDDAHLTGLCKGLRHDLVAALQSVPLAQRLAARETLADVGTGLTTESEGRRESAISLVSANLARVQEGLRSLEEFGKLFDPQVAGALESLRYSSYTLQRAIAITARSLQRLADARLYVLIDGCEDVDRLERLAASLIEAGVDVLQLRDKRLGDRELLRRARRLRALTLESGALLVVNDRPDVAVLSGADGVHVGQEELEVKEVRTIVGPDVLVGVSTHSLRQAQQAVLQGADYIGVGPTFPSTTKQFEQFPGVALLRAVAAEIRLPAFAIGGITEQNLGEVLQTGIGRVAVSGAVIGADDPAAAARRLAAALKG